MIERIIIASYLIAAVSANLLVKQFGIEILPYTAFFIIPFDMAARDFLHECWGSNRLRNMVRLVLAGSALTVVSSPDSWRVALASFVAFSISNSVNYLIYELMAGRHRLARMNISNLGAAISDSIVFPLIAFGMINAHIAYAQSTSKFVGGFIWSLLLYKALQRALALRGRK